MIVAGIDEAGYGPLLGPLVVGCSAFEVADAAVTPGPDGACPELPCIWSRLKKFVSRNRSKTGRKLHVNDSKAVYSPAGGLKELERSVLALSAAWRRWEGSLDGFVEHVSPGLAAEMGACSWYRPTQAEPFPIEQDAMSVRVFVNGLKAEMERSQARCVHLGARVLLEQPLNKLFDQTRNKSNALFSIAATHLDHLLRNYGDKGLVIFCDRQGGRAHYGHLLRLMFEDWSLEILREEDGRSDYRLTKGGHAVWITFCEKAEAQCLPVAMASMVSKYLREALMSRFNRYWQSLLPDLKPTAGYYGDGERFLQDIDAKRKELGVADHELIRSR